MDEEEAGELAEVLRNSRETKKRKERFFNTTEEALKQ